MGFYAFGTRFQSQFFARKDISWRVKKPNAKQNRFQIVTIFLLCSSAFLRHFVTYIVCYRRFWQSTFGIDPWLSKNRVSKQYWSRSPEKSQSYQASFQFRAIIGPPASDITFWIRAWLLFKELYFRKDIHKRLFN